MRLRGIFWLVGLALCGAGAWLFDYRIGLIVVGGLIVLDIYTAPKEVAR